MKKINTFNLEYIDFDIMLEYDLFVIKNQHCLEAFENSLLEV